MAKEIKIIEIKWDGPFSFEECVDKNCKVIGYGIYQIYGTHNILGENTLLYIGKASDQEFGTRIAQHGEWVKHEQNEMKFYLGRLGGETQISDEDWAQSISDAEQLLIYYCSPPYNSKNIHDYGDIERTIVLNFGKKNRIPYEVSTLIEESLFWLGERKWRLYEFKK